MTPDDPRHGTNAGYIAHTSAGTTPCYLCRVAKANYWTSVQRQRAYGRWNPWTDAAPVREHVRALMDSGMPIANIAAAADVRAERLSFLLYGRGTKDAPAKVRPDYAAAVLAVEPIPTRLDPLGVARRLQALVALGHASSVLALHLGISIGRVDQLLHGNKGEQVMRASFERVDALYERLSMELPSTGTRVEKYRMSRARNTAARNGWAPPLAWDDIDDPNEKPMHRVRAERFVDIAVVDRLLAGERVKSTRAEKVEAMARWLAAGRSQRALCLMHGWAENRYVDADQEAVA